MCRRKSHRAALAQLTYQIHKLPQTVGSSSRPAHACDHESSCEGKDMCKMATVLQNDLVSIQVMHGARATVHPLGTGLVAILVWCWNGLGLF